MKQMLENLIAEADRIIGSCNELIPLPQNQQNRRFGNPVSNLTTKYNSQSIEELISRVRRWRTKTSVIFKDDFSHYPDQVADFERNVSKEFPGFDYKSEISHSVKYGKDILTALLDLTAHMLPHNNSPKKDNNKVFIVHGHDEVMKQAVARTLEKLGLTAIILHEQANQGGTIKEKLENNSDVGFAVILYSPCDEGREIKNPEEELKKRARQNVVFEHGLFAGKLGFKNTCALYKSGVEIPGDLAGVLYVPFDDSGAWQSSLIKELKAAGCEIDANKLI